MKLIVIPALLSALSFTIYGQVGAPIMGVVPDHGALRTMRGIPAAGSVGSAFDVGQMLAVVEASPAQGVALAISAESGQLLFVNLNADGSAAQTSLVEGVAAGISKIAFSPNGTAAAVWQQGHVLVLSGFPQPRVLRDVDASSFGGDPVSIAVSDDGQWSAAAWTATGVQVFGPDGRATVLPASGTPQAVSFFHGRPDVALITDDEVATVADIGGAAARSLVWSKPAGSPPNVQYTVGFGLSADNAKLTITGNLGGVQTFDLVSGTAAYTDCGCAPTGLSALGGAVYRLTGIDAGSVKLYDASTGDVLFVPAVITRTVRPVRRDAVTDGVLGQ